MAKAKDEGCKYSIRNAVLDKGSVVCPQQIASLAFNYDGIKDCEAARKDLLEGKPVKGLENYPCDSSSHVRYCPISRLCQAVEDMQKAPKSLKIVKSNSKIYIDIVNKNYKDLIEKMRKEKKAEKNNEMAKMELDHFSS